MLYYALDECGKFEKTESPKNHTHEPNGLAMIAGIVFDDHGIEGEMDLEAKRIRSYYRLVIDECKSKDPDYDFRYPHALHSNGDRTRDAYIVRPVKELVNNSLAEFFEKATYKGKELKEKNNPLPRRKGKYHVFAILKSSCGMDNSASDNLQNDNFAGNLYYHMADEFVTHMLFYNPVLKCTSDMNCNLATRVSPDMKFGSKLSNELLQNGYVPYKKSAESESVKVNVFKADPDDTVFYELANGDLYRNLISQEKIRALLQNKICEFKVEPINYLKNCGQELLYLSDSICSYLSFGLTGNNPESYLAQIEERMGIICKSSMLFGYDTIDAQFMKAWELYSAKDYFGALGLCYESEGAQGEFAEYYKRKWFSIIKVAILSDPDAESFCNAAYKLRNATFSNERDDRKLCYIFEALDKAADAADKKLENREDRRALFMLYDSGITVYNHRGESFKAEKMFEKARSLRKYVGVDFLYSLNKRVVGLCDGFQFDKAKELADEAVEYWEWISETLKKMPEEEEEYYSTDYAKALSSRGQVLSYLRDGTAEKDFKNAMMIFGKASDNYRITQSYLIHHYLDTKNEEGYKKNAEEYFGGRRDVYEQYKYVIECCGIEKPPVSPKFALFVLLKGVYVFGQWKTLPDQILKKLLNPLKEINREELKEKDKKKIFEGHPWELIHKYRCLIAKEKGWECKGYLEEMESCRAKDISTINPIIDYSVIEIDMPEENRGEKSRNLFEKIKETYGVFENEDASNAGTVLDRTFTFMYR